MVFGSIRKIGKYFLIILLATLVYLAGKSDLEPYRISSTWISTDPSFMIHYSQDEKRIIKQSEQLIWNEVEQEVDVCFSKNTYCVYPEDNNHYSDRLFCGTWKYRGNNLILMIDEDYLFEGKYKEIIFKPSNSH